MLTLAIVALCCLAMLMITIRHPNGGVVLWLVGTCAVPYWLGLSIPFLSFTTVSGLLGIPVAVALFVGPRFRLLRPGVWDAALVAVASICFLSTQFGTMLADAKGVLLIWILPYIIGRFTAFDAVGVGRVLAWCGGVIGALSVLEIVTRFHPFVNLQTSSPLGFWTAIQTRGGLDRSEVTFGHAIALGGFLAASIPFVLLYTYGLRRYILLALVLAGTIATLSRAPLVGAGLTLCLCLIPGRGLPIRRDVLRSLRRSAVFFAAVVMPLVINFGDANQSELTLTTTYRENLLPLIGLVRPIGVANGAVYSPRTNNYIYEGWGSIDNAFLYLALSFGYIVAGALICALVVLSVRYLRTNCGPATIATIGQIPVLLSVALITQWAAIVWFVVGLAVTETVRRSTSRPHTRRPARSRAIST